MRLVLLLALAALCAAQHTFAPCVPEKNKDSVITIGKNTHVCININGVIRSYFVPLVDRLTRITINGCTCGSSRGCPGRALYCRASVDVRSVRRDAQPRWRRCARRQPSPNRRRRGWVCTRVRHPSRSVLRFTHTLRLACAVVGVHPGCCRQFRHVGRFSVASPRCQNDVARLACGGAAYTSLPDFDLRRGVFSSRNRTSIVPGLVKAGSKHGEQSYELDASERDPDTLIPLGALYFATVSVSSYNVTR
jgi:hypothetical protein